MNLKNVKVKFLLGDILSTRSNLYIGIVDQIEIKIKATGVTILYSIKTANGSITVAEETCTRLVPEKEE